MHYRYASAVKLSFVRARHHSLFRMIVGTTIALVVLLSPGTMVAASTHVNTLTSKVAAGAVAASPQVQAVFGTNGSFTTPGTGACTATSLTESAGVVLDSSGGVYIADTYANRVLHFPAGSTTPDRVYGQPDFTHCNSNQGGSPSATTLNGPWGVAVTKNGGSMWQIV